MLRILESETEIKSADKQLIKQLRLLMPKMFRRIVGHQGSSFEREIFWINRLGFWYLCHPPDSEKHWNAFGIADPHKSSTLSITCEFCVPASDINRNIGGAFASDDYGNIYLVHRGKIGGGRIGIGKTLFMNNYRGEIVTVRDGERDTDIALIGDLKSKNFGSQLATFIKEVDRIKKIPESQNFKSLNNINKHVFRAEFDGDRQFKRIKSFSARCNHGIVVNSLAAKLKEQDLNFGNTKNCDLYIYDKNKMIELYEIKTDCSRTNIYSAIGQLMLNSLKDKPKLTLVLPKAPQSKIKKALKALGINILLYDLNKTCAVFKGGILRH